MVGCDYCGEWYHGSCVGVTPASSQLIECYKCPTCTKNGATDPFLFRRLTGFNVNSCLMFFFCLALPVMRVTETEPKEKQVHICVQVFL